ncbi:putative disease resistance protein RGA1 [Chenopodium quinoa]|uniref:putative disease resistance protein RGA1 n=1 Tax=Chenopodium quinoa TaxID=63459 RepID=UPI000B780590|nr:putative disease resistance protein RGA1 [Chenopodium quinoa]
MELGAILSVVQTLFSALQCSELKEICSILGYKSELDDLQRTISTIRAVLRDAEAKQELSDEAQLWIQELKDAVYDADDLLDEFVTLAEQKQHLKGGEVSKKARLFFSRFNPLVVAYNLSRGVKKVRKKLDSVASNHRQFGFCVDHQPIRRRREETCSYVYAGTIIGRENDVENIVHMLQGNVQGAVSFLTIVGIGGLGKTALAQLVFNDERIVNSFPLRMWTCISDHDQKQLDTAEILVKILASATDDVWTENRSHWLKLAEFLIGGHKGSWIVVTTRSQETARIIGDGLKYELQGLSEKSSWRLFQKTAFGFEQPNSKDDLIEVGREIVKRCARVSLAIRVVGSLLYGQDKSKWLSFMEIGFANVRESHNDIMPILKLSYHHLESPLKSCFSYCALFPKDFEIQKEMIISLWMAQGYIVPLDEGQSMEDAAEEYFSILLRRCFFQDIQQDGHGEITSCKIHDLMHDVAQNVASKEICRTISTTSIVDNRVRHLTLIRNKSAKYSFMKTRIRSCLQVGFGHCTRMDQFALGALLANCLCLRALDLSNSNITCLPDSIGELLHLRYLDLSHNVFLNVLAKSIVKLHNLETLKLKCCYRLKELPKNLSKLIKLRVLDIEGCSYLTCMPGGMGKLTYLHTLPQFVLGETSSSWKQWADHLEDLKALEKLKGSLIIKVRLPKNGPKDMEDSGRKGRYLRSKKHLNHINIRFMSNQEVDGTMGYEEVLMEELQPHPNLMALEVSGYKGVRMPGWMTFLPNLVRIELSECEELKNLSCLGNLRHLKVLDLENLLNLDCIENSTASVACCNQPVSASVGFSSAEGFSFFPALERLRLYDLPKLKVWWLEVGADHLLVGSTRLVQCPLLSLSQLKTLVIRRCPGLTSFPLCPMVEDLNLMGFNEGLRIIMRVIDAQRDNNGEPTSTPSFPYYHPSLQFDPGNLSHCIPRLRVIRIDNVAWLNSLPMGAFMGLTYLDINCDKEVESLEEVEEVIQSCSSSLQSLCIENCPKLKNIFGGLEHLTALKKLYISSTPNLKISDVREDGSDTGMPWLSLPHNLRSLQVRDLPQMVALPEGLQYLTALQALQISGCKGLASLPNWMPKLTSLVQLDVHNCSVCLRERCQDPSGEDWPNIQHIPCVVFL